jgi:hypothetical protein
MLLNTCASMSVGVGIGVSTATTRDNAGGEQGQTHRGKQIVLQH